MSEAREVTPNPSAPRAARRPRAGRDKGPDAGAAGMRSGTRALTQAREAQKKKTKSKQHNTHKSRGEAAAAGA